MREKIYFVSAAFILASLLAFTHSVQKSSLPVQPSFLAERKSMIVRCSPDWNELNAWLKASDIPPLPGAGKYQWKISTANDSAQFYFNQGINAYYGFHIIEAMASFAKASRFDPECAMLYWAQALAYGPNINDFGYIASPAALDALEKANAFSGKASGFEKALIAAISVRYVADSADATRKNLNESYTAKMEQVHLQFPGNADAAVLYADAMMLEHPWDLWFTNGTPKPWTPRIRATLEKILSKTPLHPGANHYYIHVMEPSPFADRALPSAERLGITNPGLSHLVHMPSHIFLRTGHYQKGIDVNANAVLSYQQSLGLYAPVGGADFLYLIHNLHMKTNHAMLRGQFDAAIGAANETISGIPADYLKIPAPMGNYIQYIHSTPLLVYLRFGKWDILKEMKSPEKTQIFSTLLYHFGQGIAFAKKKEFDMAASSLDQLRIQMKDSSLYLPFVPFSPAIDAARVAEQLLLGVIHEERNLLDGAIRHYKIADSIESNMVYNEPRDWMLNPKHFLGNALMKAGKWKEALTILKKDLLVNNNNIWALTGIVRVFEQNKSTKEAAIYRTRLKKVTANADSGISHPVF